jgi:drug/metabolite transporter (DMT)-like permease
MVAADGDDVVAAVKALTGGHGPDVVIQCVGSAAVDEQAIAMGGPGGRVVLIGSSLDQFRARAVDIFWRELAVLTVFNMLFWHTLAILAIQSLSSGRAAILGYTMPVFSALIGAAWFGQRLAGRAWLGVAAAALGVVLLLWHEITALSGKPTSINFIPVVTSTSMVIVVASIPKTALPKAFTNMDLRV